MPGAVAARSSRWILAVGLWAVAASVTGAAPGVDQLGRQPFTDSRDPPSYRELRSLDQTQFDLGHAVFNTQWVPAGTVGAARRDGLGPLYNAAACDACHNEGARGRGPAGNGPAPAGLVIQVDRLEGGIRVPDPIYGSVLNTSALDGLRPEALVFIRYQEQHGRYPDGEPWSMRVPRYEISELAYGPLSPSTIIRPRLAPPLFGVGLLEAVSESAVLEQTHSSSMKSAHGRPAWQRVQGKQLLGRFGWQATSVSVRDQTTKAFSREMGLTTSDRVADDCTVHEYDCLAQPNGGHPEVSDEFLDAVVAFQQRLAVPASDLGGADSAAPLRMQQVFGRLGCTDCHRPTFPVVIEEGQGHRRSGVIAPYTDLLLHDLGSGLADAQVSGRAVFSQWRTAPLWGIGYRPRAGASLTLLHDGRARSIEEAILWHHGEAERSRQKFERLGASLRRTLVDWIATL